MQWRESYATNALKSEEGEDWDVIWTVSSGLCCVLFWWEYEFWEGSEKQEVFMGMLQLLQWSDYKLWVTHWMKLDEVLSSSII